MDEERTEYQSSVMEEPDGTIVVRLRRRTIEYGQAMPFVEIGSRIFAPDDAPASVGPGSEPARQNCITAAQRWADRRMAVLTRTGLYITMSIQPVREVVTDE